MRDLIFVTDPVYMSWRMDKLHEPLSCQASCGLPLALEVMGERWSFMILRAAFNGVRHFEDFLEELGIARNILSNRLVRLVEGGILKRDHCEDDRRRIEYCLTEKGHDLLPAMLALRQWGEKYAMGVPANPVLCDARDGLPIAPITVRAHDDRIVRPGELIWRDRLMIAGQSSAHESSAHDSRANHQANTALGSLV
jgi:DNA-binding HxlR family transcriptional regulator